MDNRKCQLIIKAITDAYNYLYEEADILTFLFIDGRIVSKEKYIERYLGDMIYDYVYKEMNSNGYIRKNIAPAGKRGWELERYAIHGSLYENINKGTLHQMIEYFKMCYERTKIY